MRLPNQVEESREDDLEDKQPLETSAEEKEKETSALAIEEKESSALAGGDDNENVEETPEKETPVLQAICDQESGDDYTPVPFLVMEEDESEAGDKSSSSSKQHGWSQVAGYMQ